MQRPLAEEQSINGADADKDNAQEQEAEEDNQCCEIQ